jgi:hypothetical protein
VLDRILVAVLPTRHDEHRHADIFIMVAHRGRAPILVARLTRCPLLEPEIGALDARPPHLLPFVADDRRIGGAATQPNIDDGQLTLSNIMAPPM